MNKKNFVLFAASLLVSAFFLAFASLSSLQREPLMIFIGGFGTWWGYLFAHKFSEGKFADGKEDENPEINTMIPREKDRWIETILGIAVLLSGYVVGTTGIKQESLSITFAAAILFWIGYVIAHYGATIELL